MTLSRAALLTIAATALLSGCATNSGSPCGGWKPIRPTHAEVMAMSGGTVAQILAHNEQGAKVCGWKP
jgi:hypothetical protein